MNTNLFGSTHRKAMLVLLLTCILAGFLFSEMRRISHGKRGDFLHFFYAAKALAVGADPYSAWEGGYIYPPLMAFLYRPLVHLPEATAMRVAVAVNACLIVLALWVAARAYRNRVTILMLRPSLIAIMVTSLFLNIDKVRLELQMCQTNVVVFLFFALGLLWLDSSPVLAGLALGFGFNIKYLTLPMIPYLILRRRWKVLLSFISSIALFALLPALESGWHQNLNNLSIAYSGLLHLVGLPGMVPHGANIEPIDAFWSVSITSGAFAHRFGLSIPPMLVVGLAVSVFVFTVVILYRTYEVPLLKWPAEALQSKLPFQTLVAIEWTGLIVFTLAFSPQTNTAHLFNALAVTTPAAVLLWSKNVSPTSKLIICIGMTIMLAGFTLPLGDFNHPQAAHRVLHWKRAGGPCWCFLLGYLSLLWGTLHSLEFNDAPQIIPVEMRGISSHRLQTG